MFIVMRDMSENRPLALKGFLNEYRRRGLRKIVSRIFPDYTASLALHKAVGFRVVGTYEKHGKVVSQWRDCVIKLANGMHKALSAGIPIGEWLFADMADGPTLRN
jgi:hypothetical protein